MQYIVFDLELNQDIPLSKNRSRSKGKYPFEIIQIGAIKLDSNLNTIDTFNSYVKPDIYTRVSPFITKLTKITTRQLNRESYSQMFIRILLSLLAIRSIYFAPGECLI